MPTERPRLTITLTPEIDRALSDFARLSGQSKSSFIVEILGQATPQLQKMAVFIQQAEAMKGEAKRAAVNRMDAYSSAIVQQAASVIKNADLFLDPIPAQQAAASSKQPAVGGGAFDLLPPLPNRGGKNSNRGGKVVALRGKHRVS